jgi:uncharacterized protein (TIGR02996 family)
VTAAPPDLTARERDVLAGIRWFGPRTAVTPAMLCRAIFFATNADWCPVGPPREDLLAVPRSSAAVVRRVLVGLERKGVLRRCYRTARYPIWLLAGGNVTAAPPVTIPAYLVAAMRANPADDGLRLQVADVFDENGQAERAEFVRVQVELARLLDEQEKCKGTLRAYGMGVPIDPLRTRERELLDALVTDDLCRNKTAWAGPAASLVRSGNPTPYQFRRGFLESVTCSAADWLAHGDAIYAREPVTSVTLTTPWPDGAIEQVKFGIAGVWGWYRIAGEVVRIREGVIGVSNWSAAVAERWPGIKFALPAGTVIRGRPRFLSGPLAEGNAEESPPDNFGGIRLVLEQAHRELRTRIIPYANPTDAEFDAETRRAVALVAQRAAVPEAHVERAVMTDARCRAYFHQVREYYLARRHALI